MRALTIGLMAAAALTVAGCSEGTEDAAETTVDSAAMDTEANVDQMGESLENGAEAVGEGVDQTGEAVANGAAAVEADVQDTTVTDAKVD